MTEEEYKRVAHWDRMPDNYNFFPKEDRTLLVNTIIADKVDSVVEFACGTGIMPKMLRAKGFKGKYVGTDVTQGFVKSSQKNNPDEFFTIADLNYTLPFADKEFDASLLVTGLGYSNDIRKTLEEIRRVTKRFIYISQWSLFTDGEDNMRFLKGEGMCNLYNKNSFKKMLTELGMEIDFMAFVVNEKDYTEIYPVSKENYLIKIRL